MSRALGLNSSAMRTLVTVRPYPGNLMRERQLSKAQSSHGVSDWRSLCSMVAPHQIRKPGGADRYDAASSATLSFSRIAARFLANSAWPVSERELTRSSITLRHTLVLLRIAVSDTRKSTEGVRATHSVSTRVLAFARACRAARPPICSAHFSASI